ncbi:putative F-box/FBD/LRR-repeat protein At5g44950 isoform X2 [Capsella rubella]|uniref:putative F-box/FBD/LRR-repeat protein At5g44950 isoform X2 n=1 Tax=Capsella rubella TaxID=81985 RepID=UPI000CD5AFAB|nr:putative F-box/FBD/LRR-repeat protein At5g44950 isoform X2 [Capsella rubella]
MGRKNLNDLPDYLLTYILSYLPTKDSVRTSVLSKRWERLWLMVQGLDLNVKDFPLNGQAFASLVDKYMEFNASENLSMNHRSTMRKFKIKYNEFVNYGGRLRELVSTVVDRKVEHLDVEAKMLPSIRDFMPDNIFKSKTLVFLKLVSVGLANPGFVVSLPCLKTMHLENNFYTEDGPLVIKSLISDCPVLEDLTLVRLPIDRNHIEFLLFLRVKSQSLKRFRYAFANNRGGTDFLVEIDAPLLEYLTFKDNQSDIITVKNLSSLYGINIDTKFNVEIGGSPLKPGNDIKRNTIRAFLLGISNVRRMIISKRTIEAAFPNSLLHILPVFLESFQNLKNLILEFSVSRHPVPIRLSYVPRCFLLTLERVELKGLIVEEESGRNLARYFLENSAVLKKLNLRFRDSLTTKQARKISNDLLTCAKCSSKCKIIIH